MHGERLTDKSLDDLLITIEQDVEGEVDTDRGGDSTDVGVHWVVLYNTPSCSWVGNPTRVMKVEDSLKTGKTANNELRATGEAGEEARLLAASTAVARSSCGWRATGDRIDEELVTVSARGGVRSRPSPQSAATVPTQVEP